MAFRHILTVLLLFVMVTSLIGIRPEGSVTEYVGKLVSQRLRRISRRSAVLNTPGTPVLYGLVESAEPASLTQPAAASLGVPAGAGNAAAFGATSATVIPTNGETLPPAAGNLGLPIIEVAQAADAATALPAGVAAVQSLQACSRQYAFTDIRPIRNMWNSSAGFCGESSMQMILQARGIWISQRQARSLAGCGNNDLILDERVYTTCNAYTLLRNGLAIDTPASSYWDSSNQTLTYAPVVNRNTWPYSSRTVGTTNPPASAFVEWMKRQIIAGRPLMVAVRLFGLNDPWYDHIVPFWGTCSDDISPTAPLVPATDSFDLSTDFGDEIFRPVTDTGFYARWKECKYAFWWGQAGCIPNDNYNFGLAVGHLRDLGNILIKTSKLVITGWSDGKTAANAEPGETSSTTGNSVTAQYKLTVSGLMLGNTYITYRYPNRLPTASTTNKYTASNPALVPTTAAALATACAQNTGCKSITYTATAVAVEITHASTLGAFAANSLQYFLTVRKV